MIKAADEIFKLQDENRRLRKELAEYKDFLDLETLEIYTENKRLKEYGAKFKDGFEIHVNKADVLAILDRLIAESEGK